jgi:hypothetical protein
MMLRIIEIIRFYEYPNRETPQHNPDSGNPLALHPIFFGRKSDRKTSFMTQKKELKVKGVYWKAVSK